MLSLLLVVVAQAAAPKGLGLREQDGDEEDHSLV